MPETIIVFEAVAPFIKLFVTVQSQADLQEKVSVLLAETDTFEWKSIWREATTKYSEMELRCSSE